MKTSFKPLFFIALTCAQYLSGTQAQSSITTSHAAITSTATTSTSATVPTPSQSAFINTPGLQVTSPYNGMTVIQGTMLSISASIQDQRPISSINISVAKKDGSSNTTIVSITSGAILKATQTWNVTAAQYPVGAYILNMVITPNTTAQGTSSVPNAGSSSVISSVATPTSSSVQAGSTSLIPIPGPPTSPGTGPNVYYWQATVQVIAPMNTSTTPNTANGLIHGHGQGLTALVLAAGTALMGSFLAL
ncbi:hypothetical protein BC939DRAFT_441618 [Gamsiella multidivaricata]|uniref:uncharacterized protein n=1 Tax=Gamsiella multidivaricata TaxID=101098 RepID=UPI00221F8782|nr:uncharacterized protein BC939DRAFT_441618 [Gamsiella multidivaricata]KAG0364480.1 hypothetical protein BGZ54_007450 [Gamsiella multidivaricata]KAI7829347.1 hypothetical protein BC939DRAFT_441618 [Gamsiella multidivaricata]